MFKERRKITACEIAVLVDGGAEHCAAVISVPRRVIGAATKKRNAKGSPADDH
jgi:hypothetical protein